MSEQPLLPRKGGYRRLRAYQLAEIIYDLTYYFAHHHLQLGDRTIDQMIQAARSGKQNIAEGSKASMTSKEMEIKLTNVAKASLEELQIDYEDYLRVRQLTRWTPSHPRYESVRRYARSEAIFTDFHRYLPHLAGEELANLAITLICQTKFLLGKLVEKQVEIFAKEGGIREQLTRIRRAKRDHQEGK